MQAMADAIEEGKRKAAAAQSGGYAGPPSLNYINWKPGDKKLLRFLSDEPIIANFAQFIVDKDGKTKNFMIPPNDPNIMDRYRTVPGNPAYPLGNQRNFKTQQVEDIKLRKMGVGIAVLRDEVMIDGKRTIQDYIYEQTVKDKDQVEQTFQSRYFGIVQQSVSNFWHTLAVSCFKRFGTICDRDYLIERTGDGLDTKYSIIPMSSMEPNDPDLATLQQVQQFYFYGYKWDMEDPMRFLKCPQTLEEWATYFSGKERFDHWLTPEGSGQTPQVSYSPPAATPQSNPLSTPTGGSWSGDGSDPMSEFHGSTTHNPPEVANAPVHKPTSTSFSSFKDDILAEAKKAQG